MEKGKFYIAKNFNSETIIVICTTSSSNGLRRESITSFEGTVVYSEIKKYPVGTHRNGWNAKEDGFKEIDGGFSGLSRLIKLKRVLNDEN